MVNHRNKHTVIHFATVLLIIIMFLYDATSADGEDLLIAVKDLNVCTFQYVDNGLCISR